MISNEISIKEQAFINSICIENFNKVPNQSIHQIVEFHKEHKYLFMTFHPKQLKVLGSIVANKDNKCIDFVYHQYYKELIILLDNTPTRKNRINTLYHIFGYFKKNMNKDEKKEFLEMLDKYTRNVVDFYSTLLILKKYTEKYHIEYLKNQQIFKILPFKIDYI